MLETAPMLPDPEVGDLVANHRITGLLGKGGMAVVYLVVDETSGERRALKLMSAHGDNEETQLRFQREYRALSQLDHPNVTRVFGAGFHGNRPFYLMECIEGHDLRVEMERWRGLGPGQRYRLIENILLQVCRALVHIHGQGYVHRDISTANIMVVHTASPSEELLVKIMDFGVVKEPGTDLTVVGEMVGTVAYMAPEQFSGQPIDERADLYSLGVVLYYLLTGSRPFQARNVPGYIDKHLHQTPRPPRELVPSVPRQLEEACLRLLAKDPSDRFSSASHLLHFLEADDASVIEGPGPRWPRRTVGRAAELARLREAISLLDIGKGGAILIGGPTGTGKSRLLDDTLAHAESRGLLVARGQSRPSRPFSGFLKIYETLTTQEELRAAEATRRVFEVDDHTAAPPERYAVYAGFLDLVRRSGVSVLLIDDLHRADRGTLELTEFLIRNLLGLNAAPVLFVLTRMPPTDGIDPLESLVSGETTGVPLSALPLGPLSPLAVEDLLLELVPGDPTAARLARELHSKSEGNPHFVVEMIRGLWDERLIQLDADGRHRLRADIDEVLDAGLPVPPSIRHALRERLVPLSSNARSLATIMAISRQEVGIDLLCRVAQMDPEDVSEELDVLLENGIIRMRRLADDERYELAQAVLRDVLLDELTDSARRQLHRRVGATLERIWRRRIPSVVDVLAWHFEQGEVPSKAFPYLLRAGEHLLAQSFVAESLDMFNRALRIEPSARENLMLDEADRLLATVLLQRSRAHAHLGRWDSADADANSAYRIAQELREPRLLALASFELGASFRRRTDLDRAESSFRDALLIAEKLGDATLRVTAMSRIGELQWARGNLDAAKRCWVEVLALGETTRDQRSLGAGYSGLGLLAVCRGMSAEARKHLDQACRVYEELGALGELLSARINLIELFHLTGNLRKGLSLADKTVAQAREIRQREGIAIGLRFRALILTDLGRVEEARAHVEEALATVGGLGSFEEELAGYAAMARIAIASDRVPEAEPWIEKAIPLLERYDTEGIGLSIQAYSALTSAVRGDAEAALQALEIAERREGRRWPVQMVRFHTVASRVHQALGRRDDARAQAHAALDLAEMAGFRFYTFKAHSLLVLAADQAADGAQHRRIALALLRSLAANMTPEESERFIEFHSGDWARV